MDAWMVLTVSAAILSAASFLPVGVGVQKTSSAPYLGGEGREQGAEVRSGTGAGAGPSEVAEEGT